MGEPVLAIALDADEGAPPRPESVWARQQPEARTPNAATLETTTLMRMDLLLAERRLPGGLCQRCRKQLRGQMAEPRVPVHEWGLDPGSGKPLGGHAARGRASRS
jgi:hypothetical protein